jgi:hypothetical protein
VSYCRWLEGDLYAYQGADGYHIHVTGPAVVSGTVKEHYIEPSAQALLARVLWLGSKGCDYSWDVYRYVKEDIVAEMEEQERAATIPNL